MISPDELEALADALETSGKDLFAEKLQLAEMGFGIAHYVDTSEAGIALARRVAKLERVREAAEQLCRLCREVEHEWRSITDHSGEALRAAIQELSE